MKKYSIVLADPPWLYNARNNKNTKFGGGAGGHYPCMTLDEICSLPVDSITEENCALFLWVTFPRLKEGLKVMESWGFGYRTVGFTWLKTNKDGSPFFGIGYYTKSNAEVCLLGIKGKMPVVSNNISQVILEPKTRHSAKPKIHNKIVQLFGQLPRVELFARDTVDGWDTFGNEVKGSIKL